LLFENNKRFAFRVRRLLNGALGRSAHLFGADSDTSMAKRSLRILVAEDEAMVALATCMELEDRGHQVFVARDGQEALEIAQELGTFDALVTDMRMPRMKGDELVRRLRVEHQDLPIVVVSANVCPTTASALRELPGPLLIFTKPYSVTTVIDEVERLTAITPTTIG
jgi:CheY-like chemotaxis protein